MKACEQKKCLHYDPTANITGCDDKTRFNQCDAKTYKGNRIITQMDMNEIIDNIAADYPVEIFPSPTAQETNKLPYNVRKYIGRISANMARVTCRHAKKELEQYFEEI